MNRAIGSDIAVLNTQCAFDELGRHAQQTANNHPERGPRTSGRDRHSNAGNVAQVGSPLELYSRPDNLFVAGFIGSPKMNLVDGEVARKWDAATIGVRPEHLSLSKEEGEWQGTVTVAEHLGSDTFLHVRADGIGQITARAGGEFGINHGDTVFMTPDPEKIHRFDADGAAMR